MHEIARLHGDARGGILRRGVDFVFHHLQPCHRNGFGCRYASALSLSWPLPFMPTTPAPSAPAATSSRGIVLGGLCRRRSTLFFGLSLEQGLPVSDRNLIIVGMNFGKG